MNCEEYRQEIAADPDFDGGAGHIAECEACRDYRGRMRALDGRIAAALAIDVPALEVPELPAVEDDNVVDLGSRPRISAPTWFAIAASTALAAVLGFRMLGSGIEYDSLAAEILAHVEHEPYSMQVTNVRVDNGRLQRVLADRVERFEPEGALITYAQSCVINGKTVPHLVIQGEQGPVMILLMPEERVASAIPLEDEDSRGVILPVGDGSIAIVGGRNERLEPIESALKNSVLWSI